MIRAWMLLMWLLPLAATAQQNATAVLDCMRNNAPPAVRSQQMTLTSTDRSGATRTIKGRVLARSEKTPAGTRLRALLKVDEPAEFAGASYLMTEGATPVQDGMYVYLPAVGRARRIMGAAADAPLLGSNFSYNDFRQMQTVFIDARALPEDAEKLGERMTHVLSFIPPASERSRYTLVRLWVDQQTCVPLKAEFHEGMNLVKEMSVPPGALQKSGASWFASELHMRSTTDGTRSVLHIGSVSPGASITPSAFDPAAFHLAP